MKLNATLTVFVLFFFQQRFSQQPKMKVLKGYKWHQLNTAHHSTILYSTVNAVMQKYCNTKIKHKIHYCKYRKTGQLCAGGITDPAVCLGLATGSHQRCSNIIWNIVLCITSSTMSYSSLSLISLSLCLPLPLPLALTASMLAKLSKWLNWGLFVVGWLVISFVSKCFQACV